MDNTEAIKWLELLKQKNIEFDDYSEDTKEIRAEATRRYQKSLSLGIQALEKQKTGHWIPVSERLPETDGDYLLFGKVVEDDTEDIFIGTYDACAEKFGYWENYYDRNTLGFLDSELIEYNKVIAWMPLPEPYKAESEE